MRRRIWIAGGLALVLILVFAGPGIYRYFRLHRSLQLARQSMTAQRFDAAGFFAHQAWSLDPRNDEALGILSKVFRDLDAPAGLYWTGLWAENNPRDPNRQLDFAQSILGSGQFEQAATILEMASRIPGVDKLRLGELQGALAVAQRRPDEAEKIFRTMVAEFPGHSRAVFNLANVLAASPLPEKRAEGKDLLLSLWGRNEMRLEASRSLVQLELAEKNANPTSPWVDFLGASPSANLGDHFAAGDAILQVEPELPASWFTRLEQLAQTPTDAYVVATWLRSHGKAERAVAWLDSRTAQRSLPLLNIARTEALADLGRWDQIAAELVDQDWKNLDDFRFAYLQEGYLRESPNARNASVREAMWKSMMQSLIRSPGDYFKLWQLLEGWKWPETEKMRILAELTASKTLSPQLLFAMVQEALRRGDTLAALYIAEAMLRVQPTDLATRNNVAMFQLLLRKNEDKAFATAAELYKEFPDNPGVIATQAFALYREGKFQEALALMDSLPKESLSEPGKALYYGLILKALGKNPEAQSYLEKVKPERLLPEERLLLFQNS